MKTLTVHPIGFIKTPHKAQAGTPIQPFAAEKAEGVITILPEYSDALADLAGFDRIWLIYWFDRAKPFALRVVPYRDTVGRGLFATRAPSRPNPLGLSVVRLAGVDCEKGELRVLDVDLLDGTPIFDIKPYIPLYDAFPDAKTGWLDNSIIERRQADQRFERE